MLTELMREEGVNDVDVVEPPNFDTLWDRSLAYLIATGEQDNSYGNPGKYADIFFTQHTDPDSLVAAILNIHEQPMDAARAVGGGKKSKRKSAHGVHPPSTSRRARVAASSTGVTVGPSGSPEVGNAARQR